MILNEGLEKFLESVKPQKISYGTNPETDNGGFFNTNGGIGTFFKFNDLYYIVLFDNADGLPHITSELSSDKVYESTFAVSDRFSLELSNYQIRMKIHHTTNMIKAFSHIIYVINEIIKYIKDVDYLIFTGVDDERNDVYSVMVNNKLLRREIAKNIKFEYHGEVYGYYIFKRIH